MQSVETKSLPENAYKPLQPGEAYRPVVPASAAIPEVTWRSVLWAPSSASFSRSPPCTPASRSAR